MLGESNKEIFSSRPYLILQQAARGQADTERRVNSQRQRNDVMILQ